VKLTIVENLAPGAASEAGKNYIEFAKLSEVSRLGSEISSDLMANPLFQISAFTMHERVAF